MRPQIPDELAERAEELAEEHGYVSAGELIRDAVRQYLSELEKRPKKNVPAQNTKLVAKLAPERREDLARQFVDELNDQFPDDSIGREFVAEDVVIEEVRE